jgi:hypothetical protein
MPAMVRLEHVMGLQFGSSPVRTERQTGCQSGPARGSATTSSARTNRAAKTRSVDLLIIDATVLERSVVRPRVVETAASRATRDSWCLRWRCADRLPCCGAQEAETALIGRPGRRIDEVERCVMLAIFGRIVRSTRSSREVANKADDLLVGSQMIAFAALIAGCRS